MLTQKTTTPDQSLPLAQFQHHLRLGCGFDFPDGQDALLKSHLRASLAVIEARISKALFERQFTLQIPHWQGENQQTLPISPVREITKLAHYSLDGSSQLLAASSYRLVPDHHRPKIVPAQCPWPSIPQNGYIEVEFNAGFGPNWSDIPADLQQAVLYLAANFYENRHDHSDTPNGLPIAVMHLIQPWRSLRLFGGTPR